ncbi:MAG TPA: hypothetical protein VEZ71_21290 [Archangium sp.]|nr:hypothetical protein [Archangium sp.]
MKQSRRNPGVALVLAGVVTGCPGPEPYNGDTYVYDGYGTIERDPDCKLTGPLELTLGEGDGTSFTPLAPGQEPVLYHGPQGGTHLILGVAVANPAVEFPGMQFKFEAERLRCFSDGDRGRAGIASLELGPSTTCPEPGGRRRVTRHSSAAALVEKGQPLYSLYSQELFAAQQE